MNDKDQPIEVFSCGPRPTIIDLQCAIESQIGCECEFDVSDCGKSLLANPKLTKENKAGVSVLRK